MRRLSACSSMPRRWSIQRFLIGLLSVFLATSCGLEDRPEDDSLAVDDDDTAADDDDTAADDDDTQADNDDTAGDDDDTTGDDDDTVADDDDTPADDDDTPADDDDSAGDGDDTAADDDDSAGDEDDTPADDDDTPADDDDTPTDDDDTPADDGDSGYNLCGQNAAVVRASGTLADPIDAPWTPFVDTHDTTLALQDEVDTYADCAPDTLEHGPEVVYRFVAPAAGDFRAELVDGSGVDIDLHLVQNPSVVGGVLTGCIARAHETLEVTGLPAGEYWLFADTWTSSSGIEHAGAYELAYEWITPDQWNEVPLGPGLTWSRLRTSAPVQTFNAIAVDLSQGYELQPHRHAGCETVAQAAPGVGALAGVNANFFAGSSCTPTDLLRVDGTLHSTNSTVVDSLGNTLSQRSVGWSGSSAPSFQWVGPGADWSGVSDAIGGYPSLVEAGTALAAVQPGTQVWSSVDWSPNPRTAFGVDSAGHAVLVTVDGRTGAGVGLSTPAFADWLVGELGLLDAIGLDGGGSTTAVVPGCWLSDTVNYPSDNSAADHWGARAVGSGLYIR